MRTGKMVANCGGIYVGLEGPGRSVFPLKIAVERSKMQDPFPSVQ